MKKLKLFILMMITSMLSFSQNSPKTFNVLENGSVILTDITKYENSINSANMESYRNKTIRVTLMFDNGFKLELLSAQELFIMGYSINPSRYSDIRDTRYSIPTFHLTNDGYLIALYQHIEK